jgi:hypothetical protein
MLGVEILIIVTQVVRGETSHFNTTTPLNAALWSVMGLSIAVVWVATLYVTALPGPRARSGPRPGDPGRSRAHRGRDGPGLPDDVPDRGADGRGHGDRRRPHRRARGRRPRAPAARLEHRRRGPADPHFVGMHAPQAIPLVLVALELLAVRVAVLRSPEVRRDLVGVAVAGFAAVLALLTWQALRGQSIVAPDVLTLSVLGLIVAATVAGSVHTLRHAPRLVSA